MTITELLAGLKAAFPRDRIEADTVRVYAHDLRDIPIETLAPVVTLLRRTEHHFPTVAAIRTACAEAVLGLPTPEEALTQVEARIRWGREQRGSQPPAVHPLVREALDHVGGWHAFRAAEKPEVTRGQFLKLYRELRGRDLRAVEAGELDDPFELDAGHPLVALRP